MIYLKNSYASMLMAGIISIALGILASTEFYSTKFSLMTINYHYTIIGWCFRFVQFLIGSLVVYGSIRGNRITEAKFNYRLPLMFGLISIAWEFACVGIVLGFVIVGIGIAAGSM